MQTVKDLEELHLALRKICDIDAKIFCEAIASSKISLKQITIFNNLGIMIIQNMSPEQMVNLRNQIRLCIYCTTSNRLFSLLSVINGQTYQVERDSIAVDFTSYSNLPYEEKSIIIAKKNLSVKIEDIAEEELNEVFKYMRTIKPKPKL